MKCCASPSTPFNSVLYGLINTSEIALFNFERERESPGSTPNRSLKRKKLHPLCWRSGPSCLFQKFKSIERGEWGRSDSSDWLWPSSVRGSLGLMKHREKGAARRKSDWKADCRREWGRQGVMKRTNIQHPSFPPPPTISRLTWLTRCHPRYPSRECASHFSISLCDNGKSHCWRDFLEDIEIRSGQR